MCYSFGKQRRDINYKSENPGPGNYNPDSKIKFNQSCYKFGSQKRDNFNSTFVPGPGSYDPKLKKGQGYSFGVKTLMQGEDHSSPGPGAYNAKFHYDPDIKFSFGIKPQKNDKIQSHVGPGSYEVKSTLQVPTTKIGTSQRGDRDLQHVPGPGSYGNTRPQTGGPKFGFGTGPRSINYTDAKPGPGSYEYKTTLTRQAPTMSGKNYRSFNDAVKNPGPGSYDPNLLKEKASVKFGKSNRDGFSYDKSIPGPGSYESKYLDKNKSPQYRLGSAQQRPNLRKSDAPGPGQYELPSKVIEGPRYGFGARPQSSSQYNNPGPGMYNEQKFGSIYEKQGAPKFGKELRNTFLKSDIPGPASYDPKLKPGGPQYGFGTQAQRSNLMKNDSPGPGNYNVPSKFSEVPKYLLPNRNY